MECLHYDVVMIFWIFQTTPDLSSRTFFLNKYEKEINMANSTPSNNKNTVRSKTGQNLT